MTLWQSLAGMLSSTALALGMATPASAHSTTEWPSKPVRMIVPGTPGGGTDIMARAFAESMAKLLGQPVVVENRPGANGLIGNDLVAKAEPDGHTLLLSNASAVSLNHALRTTLPYDTVKDLAPVMQISAGGVLLITSASVPAQNYREFVDYVREHPGIAYASFGVGSTGHLAMEAVAHAEQLQMRHIPYKGSMQIVNDLQGGVLDMAFIDARSPLPMIESGKLKAIAITGTRRVPALPDVKTLTEQGFEFDLDGWYGFFLPGRSSPELIDRVNQALTRVIESPEVQERFATMGVMWVGRSTPQQFSQVIGNDIRVWSDVVKTTGVQVD